MKTGNYKELIAWQRAMTLAEVAFAIGRQLRAAKLATLASQLERAAASIAANIAEGHGRYRPGEFSHFLIISLGSLREAETFALLGDRLRAIKAETVSVFLQQVDELGRVLYGLNRSIERRKSASRFPRPLPDS